MSSESKIRIYKTCIGPVLTYAEETRTEIRRTKRTLRTTEMKIVRKIKRVTLKNRIKSDVIRNELVIYDVWWTMERHPYWRDRVDEVGSAKTQKPNTRRLTRRWVYITVTTGKIRQNLTRSTASHR